MISQSVDLVGYSAPNFADSACAVTLLHGRNGLSARRMAVLSPLRAPSLCRQGHREFMRSAVLDLAPIMPTTACYQRNYVERYSKYTWWTGVWVRSTKPAEELVSCEQIHTLLLAQMPGKRASLGGLAPWWQPAHARAIRGRSRACRNNHRPCGHAHDRPNPNRRPCISAHPGACPR